MTIPFAALLVESMLLWRIITRRPVRTEAEFSTLIVNAPRPIRWVITCAVVERRLIVSLVERLRRKAK